MPFIIGTIIVLLIIFTVYLYLLAPGKRRDASPFNTTKFAHRGLHTGDGRVPENSLAAIRLAREAGYGVEWDVQFTADRQVVVFHDATLTRMCGVDKRVDQLTYRQLQKYTLLDSDQRIPLLTEALAELQDAPLVCEFKSHGKAGDTSLCEAAYAILEKHTGPWCMESFNPFMVGWFRKQQPQIIRGILSKRYVKADNLPGWQRVFLGSLAANVFCRPDFIAFDHTSKDAFGFRLCRRLFHPLCVAWTVRSAETESTIKNHFDTIIFESYKPSN